MNGDTWRSNVTWEHNLLMEENLQLLKERQELMDCYQQWRRSEQAFLEDDGDKLWPPFGFLWEVMQVWDSMLYQQLAKMSLKEIRR